MSSLKYPSQYEAEAMCDWYNASNQMWFGGAPMVREAFEKAEQIRIKLHMKVFGGESPWSIKRNKNGKAVVFWDKDKAEKLGL